MTKTRRYNGCMLKNLCDKVKETLRHYIQIADGIRCCARFPQKVGASKVPNNGYHYEIVKLPNSYFIARGHQKNFHRLFVEPKENEDRTFKSSQLTNDSKLFYSLTCKHQQIF